MSWKTLSTRLAASTVLSAVVAAGLVVGALSARPAQGGAAAEPLAPPGIVVNGHYVNRVLLNGKMMSLQEYGVLEARATSSRAELSLMVDPSAVGRGYFVAFTSVREREAYLNRMSPKRSTALVQREALAAAQRMVVDEPASLRLGTDRITLASCASVTQPTHQAYLYRDSQCGGTHFTALWGEKEKNLDTYGWDNEIGSMIIGDCIANIRVWDPKGAGDNGGANRNFGNSSAHTTYASLQFGGTQNWSDRISSYLTDTTGPCA